jgi:hypothetical protein
MNNTFRITDEVKRINKLQKRINFDIFKYEGKHKNDLEILILGYYTNLLKLANLPYPVYFEKRNNQDPPDFNIYDSDRSFLKLVEVTESMKPDRRRQKEYWDNNVSIKNEYNISNLDSLLSILKKKILAQYSNTDLIIWNNINIHDISQNGPWHWIIFNRIKHWICNTIIDLEKCQFENVFVIDSNAKRLLKLFPKFELVYTVDDRERIYSTELKFMNSHP